MYSVRQPHLSSSIGVFENACVSLCISNRFMSAHRTGLSDTAFLKHNPLNTAHPAQPAQKYRCSFRHLPSKQPAEYTSAIELRPSKQEKKETNQLTTLCPSSPSQTLHPTASPPTVSRNPSFSPKFPFLACSAVDENSRSSPALTRVLLYSNSPTPCGPEASVSSLPSVVRLKRGREL